MNPTSCKHADIGTLHLRPFSGPVSLDECRAAHGGYTALEQCTRCGARRVANYNGHHAEYGVWTGSREERALLEQAARAAPAPRTLRRGAHEVEVRIVSDPVRGYRLEVRGSQPHPSAAWIAELLPNMWHYCIALNKESQTL